MTENELLLAISKMMDTKLKANFMPLENQLTKIKISLENDISPRLLNIESCCTSTCEHY